MKNTLRLILTAVVSFIAVLLVYNFVPLSFFEVGKGPILGSTITTINATDTLRDSRSVINTNFSNLNTDKLESGGYAPALTVSSSTAGKLIVGIITATTSTTTLKGVQIDNGSTLQFQGYSATPQIYAGDPTTGLHFDASGVFSIHGTGVQTFLLSSTNKIGIGHSSPGEKLTVSGNVSALSFIATSTATSTLSGGLYGSLLSAPYFHATSSTATSTFTGGISLTNGGIKNQSQVVYPFGFGGLPFASSSLSYSGLYGSSGTTTIRLLNPPVPIRLIEFYCKTNIGTAWVGFGDGTSTTTQGQCSTSGTTVTPSSNNTWIAREDFFIEIGMSASNPDIITVNPMIRTE